jgi:hypothetical protein
MFTGLGYYLKYWETNSSLFYLLHSLLDLLTGVRTRGGFTPVVAEHFALVRGVTTLALLAFLVWLIRRRRPGMEWLIGATFAVLAAHLLLGAPVLPFKSDEAAIDTAQAAVKAGDKKDRKNAEEKAPPTVSIDFDGLA